jgi:hypothetical protein
VRVAALGLVLLACGPARVQAQHAHPEREASDEDDDEEPSIGPVVGGYADPAIEEDRQPFGADALPFANAPEFLPRSYVYWSSKTGSGSHEQSVVFAAEYALHLPFVNTLREVVARRGAWAYAATAFFRGELRMFADTSKPVRMPSYKPGLALQTFWHVPATRARPFAWLSGLRLEGYHYSNGQDRCTWDETLPDEQDLDARPPGPCAALFRTLSEPSDQLNRRSGEFSTNRILMALDTKLYRVGPRDFAEWSVRAGAMLDVNRPNFFGGIPELMKRLYGWGSFELHADAEVYLHPNWLIGGRTAFAYAIADSRLVPSAAGLVELTLMPYPARTGRVGLFARYYGGRDFYNAFFVDALQTFAIGLTWSDQPPLKFARGQQDVADL